MSTALRSWFSLLALLLGLAAAPQAQAGRSCEARQPTVESLTQGLALAQATAQALDASGARLALLARAGQDLSKYGLRYSHLGVAYKTPEGPWRVLHKLNQCGTAEAAIYRQGLGEFFLDDPWRYEAALLVPDAAVQQRLLALVNDPARATQMHMAPYSMVSYVWGRTYQQSNQWALETLAAAMEPGISSRAQAQAWLQARAYTPTTLKLGPLTRLGGRLTAANIAFDDHPNEKRFSDRIETVTVDSVFDWMQRAQLGGAPLTVVLP